MAVSRDDHDRFRELSALANTGALNSAELAELHGHLQFCGHCREIDDQYRLLARVGMAELTAVHSSGQEETEWDDTATRRKLLDRIPSPIPRISSGIFRPPKRSTTTTKTISQ